MFSKYKKESRPTEHLTSGTELGSLSLKYRKGFTLIEIVVFMGLATGIILVMGGFVQNIASTPDFIGEALEVEEKVSQALSGLIIEVRSMGQSNIGNYPIESASQSSLIFYSDTNKDAIFERVRYFVNGTNLEKGEIIPTGNPLQYLPGNEVVRVIAENLATTSIFSYFDSTYTGIGTSMTFPINIPDVRMVKATLSIDDDPLVPPGPFTLSRQATIRNLRSNH
jgi:hypothetical protein